jgi:hypothetical protein
MERSPISIFRKNADHQGAARSFAAALCLGLAASFAAAVASAHVVLPTLISRADIENCPGGKEWLRATPERRRQERQASSVPASNPKLREELLRMVGSQGSIEEAAQAAAEAAQAAADAAAEAAQAAADAAANAANSAADDKLPESDPDVLRLHDIIRQYGFPTTALVGSDGMDAVWTLIRRAGEDSQFQLRAAEQIAQQGANDAFHGRQIAEFIDQELTRQNQRQRYGTQFERRANDLIVRLPVDESAGLEARRAALKLMPAELEQCARQNAGDADGLLMD